MSLSLLAKIAVCLFGLFASAGALMCYTCNGCTIGTTRGTPESCNGTFSIGPMCYRQIISTGTVAQEFAGCIDLCVMGPTGSASITWTKCCTTDLCNGSGNKLQISHQFLTIAITLVSLSIWSRCA